MFRRNKALFRGFSKILEEVVYKTPTENTGLLYKAGRRVGRNTARVVNTKAISEAAHNGTFIPSNKAAVAIGLGALGIGTVKGFGQSFLESPQGYAFTQEVLAPRGYESNPLGRPLGVYDDNPLPYRVPGNNSLAATGELALAMFATRHGR